MVTPICFGGDAARVTSHYLQWWALRLATEAVSTILRVDQIIMAKQAGGPKPRQGAADEED